MKKIVTAFVAAIAIFASFAAPAKAQSGGYPHVVIGPFDLGDARIFWTGTIVGGAATGTYFALKNNNTLRMPGDGSGFNTGAFALTTIGCAAISPMIAAAWVYNTEGRMLTQREAMGLGADCVVPILGSMLVNALYYNNPQWEVVSHPVVVRRRHVRHVRR